MGNTCNRSALSINTSDPTHISPITMFIPRALSGVVLEMIGCNNHLLFPYLTLFTSYLHFRRVPLLQGCNVPHGLNVWLHRHLHALL